MFKKLPQIFKLWLAVFKVVPWDIMDAIIQVNLIETHGKPQAFYVVESCIGGFRDKLI